MAHISPLNSSSIPLPAGGVFEGDWVQASDFAAVSVLVHADVLSADDGLQLEWSTDSINVDDRQSFDYAGTTANLGLTVIATVRSQYFRVRYINTSLLPQAFFRIQTLLHNETPSGSIGYLGQGVTVNDDVLVVKAVLAARDITTGTNVVLPFASDDPFLITTRPPNSSVVFERSIAASSAFSQQLDFFGIGGANRDYMSVSNGANSDLLLRLSFSPASATAYTERVKPGETFRLGLSWILYGGPVQGIWLAPPELVGPIKYAPVSLSTTSTVIPAVAGAKLRVVNYVLSAKDEVRATWRSGTTPISGALFLKDTTTTVAASGPALESATGEAITMALDTAKLVTGHVAYVEVTSPPLTGAAQVLELL